MWVIRTFTFSVPVNQNLELLLPQQLCTYIVHVVCVHAL